MRIRQALGHGNANSFIGSLVNNMYLLSAHLISENLLCRTVTWGSHHL